MSEVRTIPKLSEVIGRGAVEFFPDLQKIKKEELIGADFVILAGKIIEDWDSEYGNSSFSLLKVRLGDGMEVTTLVGGKAVVKQVSKLLRERRLPVYVCLNKREGTYGDYFVLEDPVSADLPSMASSEVPVSQKQPEVAQPEEPIFPESEG